MLTVDEIDAARRILRSCGVIKESLRTAPARLHYHIEFERLGELLQASFRKNRKLVSEKTGNRIATKPHTSLRATRNLYKEAENTSENTPEKENNGHDDKRRAPALDDSEQIVIPPKEWSQLTSWLLEHDFTLVRRNQARLKSLWRDTSEWEFKRSDGKIEASSRAQSQYLLQLFEEAWDAERQKPASFFDAVKKLIAGVSLQEGQAA